MGVKDINSMLNNYIKSVFRFFLNFLKILIGILPIVGFFILTIRSVRIVYNKAIIFFQKLPELLLSPYARLLGTALLLIIGYLLFLFKKKQLFWYGIFEIIFAIVSGLVAFMFIQKRIHNTQEELSSFATVISITYFIVRGINNISDGYNKEYAGKKFVSKFNLETFDELYFQFKIRSESLPFTIFILFFVSFIWLLIYLQLTGKPLYSGYCVLLS